MKDNKAYQATDFLQDEGFVDWLKNTESGNTNALFWENWIKENQLKKEEVEAARRIFELITEELEIPVKAETEVWGKLQSSIISNMQITQLKLEKQRRELKMNFLKIAASLLLILGLAGTTYYFTAQYKLANTLVIIENQRSAPSTVLLADGSSVILYPHTTLTYPKNFNDDYREVKLNGKAFFEVAKNNEQPFVISSEHLFTKVIGTSFIVNDNAGINEAVVSVVQGTVALYSHNENEEDVKKGEINGEIVTDSQALFYNEKQGSFVRKDFTYHISLTFNFTDTPVLNVFDIFEEFYGVKIIVDKKLLDGCSINASLIDMPFQKKIELICKAINYQFKFENNTVVLTGEGCR